MGPTTEASYVIPADQPNTVREIAERLFPAYRLDGGSFHLAGCKLEDRPFLRLEFRLGQEVYEVFVDADGQEVGASLVERLGMTATVPLETTRRLPQQELDRLLQCGIRIARTKWSAEIAAQLCRTEVVCCKYVEGKIRFTAGNESLDLSFSGWARELQPPPFVCPHTGIRTYHLATTDDGQIAAAEAIQRCAVTGRRVLPDALKTCSVTGQKALAEFFAICPVSGQPVLQRQLVACRTCAQLVSPAALAGGQCTACRNLQAVAEDDPRHGRLTAAFPALAQWSRWQMAETRSVYIVVARRRLRRILLVVDKKSLEPRHVATGSWFSSAWMPADPARLAELLGP